MEWERRDNGTEMIGEHNQEVNMTLLSTRKPSSDERKKDDQKETVGATIRPLGF